MPMIDPQFQHVWSEGTLSSTATPSNTQMIGVQITGTQTSASGKGAWTQMIASTTHSTNFMFVSWDSSSSGGALTTDMSMDIGIGASGVENVLIPDLLVGWTGQNGNIMSPKQIGLPIYVPKNSRISVRTKTSVTNDLVNINIWCLQGSSGLQSPLFNRCDAYGVTAPAGTEITAGNAGAEGSWTNVGGTTTREYGGVLMILQGTNTSVMSTLGYFFELGVNSVTLLENYFGTTRKSVV